MTLPMPAPGTDHRSTKDDAHAPFLQDLQEQRKQRNFAITGGHALCQPRPRPRPRNPSAR